MMSLLPFWALNVSVVFLSMEGLRALGFQRTYRDIWWPVRAHQQDRDTTRERTIRTHETERALEQTLWAHGTERALERTLWAHGTERALERTLWAHGTERALEQTLWAHGTERALERTLWAHGTERALEQTLWAHGTERALERTLWAHGTERALERTLWAHGTERALERTLWAHGTERALEQTLWAHGTERALERTLWAHGTERALDRTGMGTAALGGASLGRPAARTDLMGGSSSLRTSPGTPGCAAASPATTWGTPATLAGERAKNSQNSPNVRWSCPLILHQLRGSSRALLKRSLRATSLYPNPSAAPLQTPRQTSSCHCPADGRSSGPRTRGCVGIGGWR